MDNASNLDKKDNFNKSDPFGLGILFWQKYISNFLSIYNQFIQDTQRMNQVYRESAEITKEMGSLYKELAVRIEKMNNLYRESTEITERMSKYWLDNIWKSLLPFKEKEQNEIDEKEKKDRRGKNR
jgi:Lon protease-like protein